jgi:hypothetical protein
MGIACGTCITEEKPEEMKPLGRRTCGWEDKIEIPCDGMEWDGMDFIYVAQYEDKRQAIVNSEV